MSVALTNVYTLDTFDVTRRPEIVTSTGEVSTTSILITGVRAVVTPNSAPLDRRPDADVQGKNLEVTGLFLLRGVTRDGQAQDWKPDVVTWKSNNYLVKDVKDYSRYGRGFTAASLDLFDTLAQPPNFTVASNNRYTPNMRMYELSGTGNLFSLPFLPSVNAIQVFFDGVQQPTSQWQLLGPPAQLKTLFNVGAGDNLSVWM